ncbi:hypothetical protein L7F22_028481 [Adiantum nelumboides]|nr:hypothetical protein [Adiantum nelumboides]MCO5574691.1 hypothetical protein [Adiantum nelumboides]
MAPPSLDCSDESLLCWEGDVSVSLSSHGEEQESGDYPFLICKNSTLELATSAMEMQESDLQVAVSALIKREIFHAPCSDYAEKYETKLLDAGSRQKAISWLFKVRTFYNFGPLTAALSVNYLDRFLSRCQIPMGKAWMLQLLSVACLSLAAKMEEVEVPLLLELQVAPDCLFESQTIQRMELLLLSTLEWRVSSVTPFSYVDYFLCKCSLFGSTGRVMVLRTSELILCAMEDLRFLSFQSSCVAAAAFLCAAKEILPLQLEELNGMLTSMLPSPLQDLLAKCLRLMVDQFNDPSCPANLKADSVISPAGVLDASFSSDSESTFRSIGSDPSVQISSPASKKRRVDNLCSSVPCNS